MFQLFVTDVDLLNLTVLREVLRISVDYHLVDFESKRIHFTWLVSEHGSSRHRQVPKQQMVHINMYNFYVSVKISVSVKIKNKTSTDIIQVPIDMMLGREAKSSKQKYRLRTVPLLKLLLTQTFELNGDICPSEGTSKCLWKVALNGKCISVKGNFEIHAYEWLSRSLQKMSICEVLCLHFRHFLHQANYLSIHFLWHLWSSLVFSSISTNMFSVEQIDDRTKLQVLPKTQGFIKSPDDVRGQLSCGYPAFSQHWARQPVKS